MNNKFVVSITTFKKPKALERSLETLPNIGFHNVQAITVAEDGENPTGLPIIEKYNKLYEEQGWNIPLVYIHGSERIGIARTEEPWIKVLLRR